MGGCCAKDSASDGEQSPLTPDGPCHSHYSAAPDMSHQEQGSVGHEAIEPTTPATHGQECSRRTTVGGQGFVMVSPSPSSCAQRSPGFVLVTPGSVRVDQNHAQDDGQLDEYYRPSSSFSDAPRGVLHTNHGHGQQQTKESPATPAPSTALSSSVPDMATFDDEHNVLCASGMTPHRNFADPDSPASTTDFVLVTPTTPGRYDLHRRNEQQGRNRDKRFGKEGNREASVRTITGLRNRSQGLAPSPISYND